MLKSSFRDNDRRSFDALIALGVMNSISDVAMAAFFRYRLRKAQLIVELLDMFESCLCWPGLHARSAAKSLMQLLFPFPSGAMPPMRTQKSKHGVYRMVWIKKNFTACSRGNWPFAASRCMASILADARSAFASKHPCS